MSWLVRKSSKKGVEAEEGRRHQPGGRNRTPASTRSVSSSGQTFDNSSDADFLDHDPNHEDNERTPQQAQPRRTHFAPSSASPRGNNNLRQESNTLSRNNLHRSGSASPRNQQSNSFQSSSPRNMNNAAAGNMNYSPNGLPQTRYSMSGGAPSNIFAPVVNSSSGATIASGARNSMGFSQQPSGGLPMIDYGGSPYGPTSPMPSSSGSVVLTPPNRPVSMNLGSMNSGGSVAPMMNGVGMNSMSMNNMRLNNNVSMNNMAIGLNGLNAMGMNNISMNNMSMSNMNNPMTSIMPTQGLVDPAAGFSPIMMSPAGLSPMGQVGMMPSVSGLNMMGGMTLPQYAAAATPPNPVFNPLVTGISPYSAPAVSQLQTGQLQYLSPVGCTASVASVASDPALELALRQSLVESAPRWVADRSYQVAREESLKKENDEMLERAIRQSLDETNLHRLRQDEIERSNRILQQSNERALEEAIRASLQDYSTQDVQGNRALDAIEQANEDALQKAILQSMRESSGTGASSILTTSAKYTTTTNQGQRTVTITRTNKGQTNASVGDFKGGVVSPNYNNNNQSPRGNINNSSNKDENSSVQQPYRPGPFPPEPPPEVPYYQLQYQQTLQQQQHNQPPVPNEEFEQLQRTQRYYNPDGSDENNDNNNGNPPNTQNPRAQMMMGMMMRLSYDNPVYQQQAAQQSRVAYQQRQPFSDQPQVEREDQDDDDEFMQPATYTNSPQQPLRQQPSSQFISVSGGQMRGVQGSGSGHMHTGNDGETVVSSTSSGAGIGRNTAAQVTSLYMNNPDLIEQEMQQRYQRQYQLYLQNQLANADMANQRLASSSQDAFDQIQQHHGPQSAGRLPHPLSQQQPHTARAIFEPVIDTPPTSSQPYPYQQQQQQLNPNAANYPAPFRQQAAGVSSTSGKYNQRQQLSQQQYNDDQEDNSSKATSSNLSGNGASIDVSGARRLSQVQSFMGNPLMQSRHSAVAQQQHIHSSNSTSEANSPVKTSANGAAVSMQSPNKAAFMEKLRRKSGSYNANNDTSNSDVTAEYKNANINVLMDDEKLVTQCGSYLHAPDATASFHSPKYVDHGHQSDGSSVPASNLPSPPLPFSSMKSVDSTASQPTNLTNSQKSNKAKSFSAPRASFHQFVNDIDRDTENNNAAIEANLNYHPHGGHHALGIHHEAPHRLSVTEDEYGIPITVDEKHHPHLHHLKAALSQTQMSLSSDSDEDEDFFRPTTNDNSNTNNSGTNSINNNNLNGVPSFPIAMPNNTAGKTMKKTFSAPKMIDLESDPIPMSAPLNPGPSALKPRPGMYDRSAMESVDLDPSKITIQRKIIHNAPKPV